MCTRRPVKFQLVSRSWNGSKIKWFLSYLLINAGKFYRLSCATFYDCIDTIYQFIKPFLGNKIPIFEEYGALKGQYLVIVLGYFFLIFVVSP